MKNWILWCVAWVAIALTAGCGTRPPDQKTIELGGDLQLEMVLIPAGSFVMGDDKDHDDEKPTHKVTITKSFYLSQFEVTVEQFRQFVEATGYVTDAEKGWQPETQDPSHLDWVRVRHQPAHPHCLGLRWEPVRALARDSAWRMGLPLGLLVLHQGFFSRHPEQYLGHNPLGRLSVTAMLLLLLILAVSGVVLAGTDLFYPPFGSWIATWVAAPGIDPGTLVPGQPDMYDKASFDSMRAFRKPIIFSHLYVFYALLIVGALHIIGVVITEIREGGSLISATFTGRKILAGQPVDEEIPSS